jgi:hypothetical protein
MRQGTSFAVPLLGGPRGEFLLANFVRPKIRLAPSGRTHSAPLSLRNSRECLLLLDLGGRSHDRGFAGFNAMALWR